MTTQPVTPRFNCKACDHRTLSPRRTASCSRPCEHSPPKREEKSNSCPRSKPLGDLTPTKKHATDTRKSSNRFDIRLCFARLFISRFSENHCRG